MQNIRAEVLLPTKDLLLDIPFFTKVLGMRMDEIFPADDPSVAVFFRFWLTGACSKGRRYGAWCFANSL